MGVDSERRARLRAEGQGIGATVRVGKEGLTEAVVQEVDAQLKRNHLVKVRLQRTAAGGARDAEETISEELATRLGAELVERRGHTALLYRRAPGR